MDHPDNVSVDRRRTERVEATAWDDFFYDAFYGGAIGGSTVALVGLLIDLAKFEPLFMPSLIGSALFLGADPASVTEVRMDMVAYFTAVHIVAFLALGLAMSAMVQRMHELALHPVVVTVVIFLALQVGFVVADRLFLGGVVGVIGFWWIALPNALGAAAMGIFLLKAHSDTDTVYVANTNVDA
ncbi:MAG TPA: hypothetical protein VMN39_06040 [Longimicrobiaceae bacterium]|nr:hypothetical protein [Longimicrobiaceae bacterium]